MRGRRPRRECQFESGLVLHTKESRRVLIRLSRNGIRRDRGEASRSVASQPNFHQRKYRCGRQRRKFTQYSNRPASRSLSPWRMPRCAHCSARSARGVAVNSERRVRTRGSASSRVWQRFEPGAITKLRSRHTDSRGRYGVEKPTSGIVIRAGSHP